MRKNCSQKSKTDNGLGLRFKNSGFGKTPPLMFAQDRRRMRFSMWLAVNLYQNNKSLKDNASHKPGLFIG
jgi:hypothetical protein